ncbi:hypothetical protein Ancab_036151 [Ancistrocladus abbreviatus]
MELCLNSEGDKKLQYINYFMHRINLLRYHKITPVVVFDGGNIPCKAATENERYRRRKANRELAMEKLQEGNIGGAAELFQILRSEDVEFTVAPYEADAQLAYLSSIEEEQGGVVAVITEDSDLLAYGCPAIIFKMDRYGNGEEIMLDKVFSSNDHKPSFRNFNRELFTDMCVLAGCDFLQSVPGIGIVKAHSLVSKYCNIDRVLSALKFQKGSQVPEDYTKSFREAVAVFQHARVYDKDCKRLQFLKPIPEKLLQAPEELDFLGPDIPPSVAAAIAEGKLDPTTMEAYDHCSPCSISPPNRVVIQSSEKIDEADSVTTIKSCFTVYSSRKTKEQNISNSVMVERGILKERNYSDEAALLAKLVPPLEVDTGVENLIIRFDEHPLQTPDNNPFKKRKLTKANTGEVESIPEQESEVTEIEKSDTLCFTVDSQESVNSKPKRIEDGKEVGKCTKRLKMSNSKGSQSRMSSILNYFSRL